MMSRQLVVISRQGKSMKKDIFSNEYTPRFTGHETFHLRYGWLKKSYDAIKKSNANKIAQNIFKDESSISYFGVGKNMVSSIKHWALAFGLLKADENKENDYITTSFADFIFDLDTGCDPYLEHLSTLWILHWKLVTESKKTTFIYAFNLFNEPEIERDSFLKSINQLITKQGWPETADKTIQKDISNLIGTYALRRLDKRLSIEDIINSPFIELQLLSQTDGNSFKLNRGKKVGLSIGVFAYCLLEFWNREGLGSTTLSFEKVCHDPFSPGRAFVLTQQDIMHYIEQLETFTKGAVYWVESSGSRHIARINGNLKANLEWIRPYVIDDKIMETA